MRLIDAIRRRALAATTTVEVIQEFVHVFGRRRDRRDAARLGRAWAVLLAPLITTGLGDLEQGLTLYERTSRLGPFDAVLAAAAIAREAEALVSADEAFAGVPGLGHVNLAGPAVDELLGAAGA